MKGNERKKQGNVFFIFVIVIRKLVRPSREVRNGQTLVRVVGEQGRAVEIRGEINRFSCLRIHARSWMILAIGIGNRRNLYGTEVEEIRL